MNAGELPSCRQTRSCRYECKFTFVAYLNTDLFVSEQTTYIPAHLGTRNAPTVLCLGLKLGSLIVWPLAVESFVDMLAGKCVQRQFLSGTF